MKLRLIRVPARTLRRGDEFVARWRSKSALWHGDWVIIRVLNAQVVTIYDGPTRELIGNAGFPEGGHVWKIAGQRRGKL